MQSVVVLTPADVSWKVAESQASAVGSGVLYRKLGGVLEIMLNATCTAYISSEATLAILPTGFRPARNVLGTLIRYTSATDTTPDVRRCTLGADGRLLNSGGLVFAAGYTIIVSLQTPLA